jgi:hypothetical protein
MFRLIPIPAISQHQASFVKEALDFAGQSDSERTVEGTLERLVALGLRAEAMATTYQSSSTAGYNPHNTRFHTVLEPEESGVIRYLKLRPLGSGGQGDVHKLVDMFDGSHHACKTVAVKAEVPALNIYSERDFRAKIEREVNLVQRFRHVSTPMGHALDAVAPASLGTLGHTRTSLYVHAS